MLHMARGPIGAGRNCITDDSATAFAETLKRGSLGYLKNFSLAKNQVWPRGRHADTPERVP